jgi:hypothetical protein
MILGQQTTEDNMKTSFTHKHFDDKVLVTLFVNGKKEGSLFKMNREGFFSHYENLKDAEKSLLLNYQARLDFESIGDEEEGE